jgi:hypothetical protein
MPQKKKGFTLDQHEQLGLELQTMHDRFVKIKTEIDNHYATKGSTKENAPKLAARIYNDLINLRGALDKQVGNEQSNNKNINSVEIYFRATRDDHIKNPQPIRPLP